MPATELIALRDSVRGLLSRKPPLRGTPDSGPWRQLCDIGAAALLIPSTYGGLGAGLPELGLVQAELGRALTPTPLLGSAVLATTALHATGAWDPSRAACASSPALTGTAHYVLDATAADVLLVVATTPDGIGLFEVDPHQARRRALPPLDPTRPLGTVELSSAPARRLGAGDFTAGLAHTRDVACVALAAEQTGAARRCLELTVDYAKTRIQFGQPIGAFQAVQHRLADLHVLVETAESTWLAAATTPSPSAAAVAAVHCSEAFSTVAAEMIQLHGGIAITWDHDAHRYFKRAHGSAHLFGHPSTHIARLTQTWAPATAS